MATNREIDLIVQALKVAYGQDRLGAWFLEILFKKDCLEALGYSVKSSLWLGLEILENDSIEKLKELRAKVKADEYDNISKANAKKRLDLITEIRIKYF